MERGVDLTSVVSPASTGCTMTPEELAEAEEGEEEQFDRRTRLPMPMYARNDFGVWSVLKQCIGKDLSKITMPIIFNEPLSFLQRISEYMEYGDLLNKAGKTGNTTDRMQYVAAFAVSALASNWERVGKPFNPLLGETYELERNGYRLICEQVSHHPPISAFHANSPNFIFHGSILPKLKFWGKSVEIQPKGVITVELPKYNEVYTWNNISCCIHNIIVGQLWIEQYGVLEIVNHKNGYKCVLNFKPAGWFSKDLHRVEGFIFDKSKKKVRHLYGKWTDRLKSVDIKSYEEYLKSNPQKSKHSAGSEVNTPTNSPRHTPKKTSTSTSAKLNSLKSLSSATSTEGPDPPANGYGAPSGSEGPPRKLSVLSLDIPNSITLWEAVARPSDSSKYYEFSLFAMSLNEMEPGMERTLAPTDSRRRPDIRMLEEGDIDGAALEKTRVEEKQRDSRASRKPVVIKDTWKPIWFKPQKHPQTREDDWQLTGEYWSRNFSACPDIF